MSRHDHTTLTSLVFAEVDSLHEGFACKGRAPEAIGQGAVRRSGDLKGKTFCPGNLLSRPSPSVKWLAPDPDDRHKGFAPAGSLSIVVGLTWQPASSLFLSSMLDSWGYPVRCARRHETRSGAYRCISRSSSPPRTRRPVCSASDRGFAPTAPGLSQMSTGPTRESRCKRLDVKLVPQVTNLLLWTARDRRSLRCRAMLRRRIDKRGKRE